MNGLTTISQNAVAFFCFDDAYSVWWCAVATTAHEWAGASFQTAKSSRSR